TYRDSELGRAHPLTAMLADLRRIVGIRRLTLGGLDAEAVSALVDAAGHDLELGGRALARALHAKTNGNPFFVAEMLEDLAHVANQEEGGPWWHPEAGIDDLGLPQGIRDAIGRRLSRLSQGANRSLAVASTVGTSFSFALLERVPDAAADAEQLLENLEEALAAGLLVESPGRADEYAFPHALVRQALYAELTSARRLRLHRRIAEAIEGLPGDRRGQLTALAFHFAEANGP